MTAARGGGMNSLGVDTQEVAGRGGPTPYNSSGTLCYQKTSSWR